MENFAYALEIFAYVLLIAVLVVLFKYQVKYRSLSSRASKLLAKPDFGKETLDPIFEDVKGRSRLGWPPDWISYSGRFERLTELPLEKIRQCAGAALATGIASTVALGLAALINPEIHEPLLNGSTDPGISGEAMLLHAGFALLASLFGIIVHLYIILSTLKTAQRRAEEKVDSLLEEVRVCSQENPPRILGERIAFEIGDIFQKVVGRLPEQLQSINESVKSLKQVIGNQLAAMKQISEELPRKLSDFTSAADLLASTTSSMGSYSQSITESADLLKGLPENLESTLTEASNVWKTEIQAGNNSFVSVVRDTLADQQKLLSGMEDRFKEQKVFMQEVAQEQLKLLRDTVSQYGTLETLLQSLPEQNGEVFVNAFEQFQAEARNHVRHLGDQVGSAVGELLNNQNLLFNGIDSRLEEQGNTIQVALDILSNRQRRLDEQYEELHTLITGFPEKNRAAVRSMIDAFNAEARKHVFGLRQTLSDGLESLKKEMTDSRKEWHRQFVSQAAQTMREILSFLQDQVDEEITKPLTVMGSSLEQAAKVLPDAAERFAVGLKVASNALEPIPGDLESALQKIEKVKQDAQKIQHDLTEAFTSAAISVLEPVGDSIDELIKTAEKDHKLISDNANDLVKLISGIIVRRGRLMN